MDKNKIRPRRFRDTVVFKVSDEQAEGGMVIEAQLKVWDKANYNGEVYLKDSYDEFIKDYYADHQLNMPLTVQHGQRVEDIIGKILSLDKTEEGLVVKAQILDGLPNTETVKTLVKAGVLQGLSDEGYATDYDYKDNAWTIKSAAILAISLVATPAEAVAKVNVKNAIAMSGFNFQDDLPKGVGRLRQRRNGNGN